MDRSLLGRLLRPRHLLATLVIALVVGGGAGSLVGVVRAQDPDAVAAELPPPFALGMPREGDRGRYVLEKSPLPLTDDQRRAGFEDERAYDIDFTMGAYEVQYDANGTGHWARRVQVETFEQDGEWNRTSSLDAWFVGMRSIAGWNERIDDPTVRDSSGILPGQGGEETSQTTWRSLVFEPGHAQLPCGILNQVQGTQPPPAGTLVRGGPECLWGEGPRDPNAHWTVHRGVNRTGFLVVDHYRTHPDDQPQPGEKADWTEWYRADIPYPVQMRTSWSDFGGPGDLLRLVGFERGAADDLLPTAPPAPLPPVQHAPRPAWLLDDSGVEHPFPLSAAIQHVLTDPGHPGLRDYLASRPDAYVHWARHAEFDIEGRHSHRWSFEYTDGSTVHQEVVSQDIQHASPVPIPGLPAIPGTASTTYSYEEADHSAPYGDWNPVPAAALPASTPTVASLLQVWEALPMLEGNEDAASSWAFQVGCQPDGPCDSPSLLVSAGQVYYYRVAEPGYPIVDNRLDVWDTSELTWSDGALRGAQESDQVHVRTATDVVPPASPPASETAAAALSPLPTPTWLAPTPAQAVGIGFGALLVAGLYWLWPALKGGGVGLFSRVSTDRLLDNPLRQLLVDRIAAEPGIHHNALVRDLGKGKGAAEHHLDKLVAGRLVLRHRSPGYTCYFPVGTDYRAMAATPATKADGARRVLEALQRGLGGVREVAQATGLAPSTVSHHLERLRGAGLVAGDGRAGYRAVHGPGSPAAAAGA